MELNEEKTKRQNLGINRWINNKGIGTLHWEPGTGKTYLAIILINKIFSDEKNKDKIIIIVVPSEYLKNKWLNDIAKHCEKHFNRILVFTRNFLGTSTEYLDLDIYLLIIDEIHEFFNTTGLNILKKRTLNYKFLMGLTGTLPEKYEHLEILKSICPVVDILTEQEAIEKEFISNFIEYNYGVEMSDYEKDFYDRYSLFITENFPIFKKDLTLLQNCLSGNNHYTSAHYIDEVYMNHSGEYSKQNIYKLALNILENIRNRKNLMYNSETKLQKVLEIVKLLKDKKIISFTESKDFAEKVYREINNFYEQDINSLNTICTLYHSTIKSKIVFDEAKKKFIKLGMKRLKDIATSNILDNVSNIISTTSALDRGLNIENLDFAIISSRKSNSTQAKQRNARVKRIDYLNKDSISTIINIYYKNTVDESWLKEAQKNSLNEIIEINDLNCLV